MSRTMDECAAERRCYARVRAAAALASLIVLAVSCESSSDVGVDASGGAQAGESPIGGEGPVTGSQGGAGNGGLSPGGRGGVPSAGQDQGGRSDASGGVPPAGHGGEASERDVLAALSDLVSTYCQVAVGCCTTTSVVPDVATCIDESFDRIPVVSIFAHTIRVDLEKVESCRAAIASTADCDPLPTTECGAIYVPLQLPGQPCTEYGECVQSGIGVDCLLPLPVSAREGVCTEITVAHEGEACLTTCLAADGACDPWTFHGNTAAVCRLTEGVYCDTTAADPTCDPVLEEGDRCNDGYACGIDGSCYYDDTLPGKPTICIPGHKEAPCVDAACEDGLICIDTACGRPKDFGEMPGCGTHIASLDSGSRLSRAGSFDR